MTLESPQWQHYELVKTVDPAKPCAPRWLEGPVRVTIIASGRDTWAIASRDGFAMAMCCATTKRQAVRRLHHTWLRRAQLAERLIGLVMESLLCARSKWQGRKDAPRGAWRAHDLCERLKAQIDSETVDFVLGQLARCGIVIFHPAESKPVDESKPKKKAVPMPWFSPNLEHESVIRMEVARIDELLKARAAIADPLRVREHPVSKTPRR